MNLPTRAIVLEEGRDFILPAVIAAGCAVALVRVGARAFSGIATFNRQALDPATAILAIAATIAAGNAGFMSDETQVPWVPDGKWWHWGLWAIAAVMLMELFARTPNLGVGVGHLIRGTTAGVIASFVIDPRAATIADERWRIPALAMIMASIWSLVDVVGRRAPGGSTTAAIGIVGLGAMTVLLHHHSLGFTNLCLCLVVGLFFLVVMSQMLQIDVGAAAAASTAVIIIMLVLGWFTHDSKIAKQSFLLIAIAPATLGFFLIPPLNRIDGRPPAVLIKLLLVAIPVAWSVYQAMSAEPIDFDSLK